MKEHVPRTLRLIVDYKFFKGKNYIQILILSDIRFVILKEGVWFSVLPSASTEAVGRMQVPGI